MRSSSKFWVEACSIMLSGVVTTMFRAVDDDDSAGEGDEKPPPPPTRRIGLSLIALKVRLPILPLPPLVSGECRECRRRFVGKPKRTPDRVDEVLLLPSAPILRNSGLRSAAPYVGNMPREISRVLSVTSFGTDKIEGTPSRPSGRSANAACLPDGRAAPTAEPTQDATAISATEICDRNRGISAKNERPLQLSFLFLLRRLETGRSP